MQVKGVRQGFLAGITSQDAEIVVDLDVATVCQPGDRDGIGRHFKMCR